METTDTHIHTHTNTHTHTVAKAPESNTSIFKESGLGTLGQCKSQMFVCQTLCLSEPVSPGQAFPGDDIRLGCQREAIRDVWAVQDSKVLYL